MSLIDFLILLLNIYWLVAGIETLFRRKYKLSKKDISFLKILFIYHQVISLVFSFYVLSAGGDAKSYWFLNSSSNLDLPWFDFFTSGTSFIYFLTYPLVKFLNMSFYFGGLMFGFLGYLGFVYLFLITRSFTNKILKVGFIKIFPLILFLPNLHFWSSGIGKDACMFFAILLFFHQLFLKKKNYFLIIFALTIIYFIRSYIDILLLLSVFIALIIDRKLKIVYKVFFSVIIITVSILLINPVLNFIQIEDVNSNSLSEFSNAKAQHLGDAGSGVNISNYSLPLKIFTLLFRPLFFDINNSFAIIASFENLFLLYLCLLCLFKFNIIKAFKARQFIQNLQLFFLYYLQ